MANRCDVCDKTKAYGMQSRHRKGVAGKQWAKRAQKTVKMFAPNIQHAKIDGVKMTLCAKCLKKIRGARSAVLLRKAVKTVDKVAVV